MKKVLFILQKPPHLGSLLQETLDVVMTVAAFDQDVSLLLLDKAVFHLKKSQTAGDSGLKDTASIYKALPLYNIRCLYAEAESLQDNGLFAECLSEPVNVISRYELSGFIQQFDLLLSG